MSDQYSSNTNLQKTFGKLYLFERFKDIKSRIDNIIIFCGPHKIAESEGAAEKCPQ